MIDTSRHLKILSYTGLPSDILAKILKEIPKFVTPDDVVKRGSDKGFTLRWIDHMNRVATMCYNGIEVLMFYRLQVSDLRLLPNETTKATEIVDTATTWVRLTLIKTADAPTAEDVPAIDHQLQKLELLASTQRQEIELYEQQLKDARESLGALRTELEKYNPTPAPVTPVTNATIDPDSLILLKRLRPRVLQAWVQDHILWGQGILKTLPPRPKLSPKKIDSVLKRIEKNFKKAKKNRTLVPFTPLNIPVKAKKQKWVVPGIGKKVINPSPEYLEYLQSRYVLKGFTKSITETEGGTPTVYKVYKLVSRVKKQKPQPPSPTKARKNAKKPASNVPTAKKPTNPSPKQSVSSKPKSAPTKSRKKTSK